MWSRHDEKVKCRKAVGMEEECEDCERNWERTGNGWSYDERFCVSVRGSGAKHEVVEKYV